MRPLIVSGDTVTFQPRLCAGRITVGDLVVFRLDQTLVVHRIIDCFRRNDVSFFKEKGDNRFFPTVIPSEDIIGRVCAIHKKHATIDLTTRRWMLINTAAGYYWKVLFRLLGAAVYIKKAFFGSHKFPGAAAVVRKIAMVFSKLPTYFFGFRRD